MEKGGIKVAVLCYAYVTSTERWGWGGRNKVDGG